MVAVKHFTFCVCVLSRFIIANQDTGHDEITESSLSPNGTTFIFADLNATGFNYVLRGYIDENGTPDWALGPYVEMAKNIILILSGLDLDILKQSMMGEPIDVKKVVVSYLPLMILFVVLLITSLCTPFIGFFFCLCRLCGKCGGRMTVTDTRQQKKWKAVITFVFLIICVIALIVGAGSIWTVGQVLPTIGDHIVNVLSRTVTDVKTFVNQLFQDLMQIAVDDVGFVTDEMAVQIRTMPEQLIGPFMTASQQRVGLITDSIDSLVSSRSGLQTAIAAIDTTSTNIDGYNTYLQSELVDIQSDIDDVITACGAVGALAGMCNPITLPTIDFGTGFDTTSLNVLLSASQSLPIEDIGTEVDASLANIPILVNTSTWELRESCLVILHEISTVVEPLLVQAEEAFDNGTRELDDVDESLSDLTKQAEPHVKLVTQVFMGISALILFIVIFDITGMILGLANCKYEAAEYRGRTGHIGGHCIMVSVVLSFLFIFFYLFIGTLFMLFGSILTSICEPVRDLRLFTEVMDDPAVWDNEYLLGKMLLDNGSVPLTINGIFDECRQNTASYTALKLKHRVDIRTLVDIEDQLPPLTPMKNIVSNTLRGITLLGVDSTNTLNSFITDNSGAFSLDVASEMTTFNTQLGLFTFTSAVTDLDTLRASANAIGETAIVSNIDSIKLRLLVLETTTKPNLQTEVDDLETHLTAASDNAAMIENHVQGVISNTQAFETYLHNDGVTIIGDSMDNYVAKILSFASQSVIHVDLRLRNDMARCSLVWDVYDGATGILCVYFLDAFNGLWLSLVLIGIFLVVNICVGVRMVKYFRKPFDADKYRVPRQQSSMYRRDYSPPATPINKHPQVTVAYNQQTPAYQPYYQQQPPHYPRNEPHNYQQPQQRL